MDSPFGGSFFVIIENGFDFFFFLFSFGDGGGEFFEYAGVPMGGEAGFKKRFWRCEICVFYWPFFGRLGYSSSHVYCFYKRGLGGAGFSFFERIRAKKRFTFRTVFNFGQFSFLVEWILDIKFDGEVVFLVGWKHEERSDFG